MLSRKKIIYKENLTTFFILEQESSAKFTSELKDQRGVDGMKLKLEAFFAGNPEPEVTWEGKDGKPIENSKNIQVKVKPGRTTMTVFEAQQEHNGYYTCRVKNKLGSDRTRGQLTVKSKYYKTKVSFSLKVSKFQNEFMKSSFLPKYEPNIGRISALYCATLQGRCPYNFWFIFW